jgi:hypothetical protein
LIAADGNPTVDRTRRTIKNRGRLQPLETLDPFLLLPRISRTHQAAVKVTSCPVLTPATGRTSAAGPRAVEALSFLSAFLSLFLFHPLFSCTRTTARWPVAGIPAGDFEVERR